MLGKKGALDMEAMVTAFFRIPIILLTAFAVLALVLVYIKASVDVFGIESNLFMYSMLNTKDGISYYDEELERLYPGVVDIDRFADTYVMEKQLNETFNYGEYSVITVNMTLKSLEGDVIEYNNHRVEPVVYHKKWYERWIVLARTFLPGRGSIQERERSYYVLLRYPEGKIEGGVLQISLLMPND